MKEFKFVIKDELGIHARPAGLLVKEAKKYESIITIEKEEKKVDATKLMAVMSMGIKQNDEICVSIEGQDEEKAFQDLKLFFENQL